MSCMSSPLHRSSFHDKCFFFEVFKVLDEPFPECSFFPLSPLSANSLRDILIAISLQQVHKPLIYLSDNLRALEHKACDELYKRCTAFDLFIRILCSEDSADPDYDKFFLSFLVDVRDCPV